MSWFSGHEQFHVSAFGWQKFHSFQAATQLKHYFLGHAYPSSMLSLVFYLTSC